MTEHATSFANLVPQRVAKNGSEHERTNYLVDRPFASDVDVKAEGASYSELLVANVLVRNEKDVIYLNPKARKQTVFVDDHD